MTLAARDIRVLGIAFESGAPVYLISVDGEPPELYSERALASLLADNTPDAA